MLWGKVFFSSEKRKGVRRLCSSLPVWGQVAVDQLQSSCEQRERNGCPIENEVG